MKTFIGIFIVFLLFCSTATSAHPPRERRLHRIEHRLEHKIARQERRNPAGIGRRDERLQRRLNVIERHEARVHRRQCVR